jgi:hypothetical protein
MANIIRHTEPQLANVSAPAYKFPAKDLSRIRDVITEINAVRARRSMANDRDKITEAIRARANSFAVGEITFEEAVATPASAAVDGIRTTLAAGCERELARLFRTLAADISAVDSARLEDLRKRASDLENTERNLALELGEKPDAFQPSQLLRSLRETFRRALEETPDFSKAPPNEADVRRLQAAIA